MFYLNFPTPTSHFESCKLLKSALTCAKETGPNDFGLDVFSWIFSEAREKSSIFHLAINIIQQNLANCNNYKKYQNLGNCHMKIH